MTAIDQAEFGRLASDSTPQLRATIRRLVGHPDTVDDLVQQSLLRAWEQVETFRGDSAFATWLCTIGSRLTIDYL